VKTTPLFNLAHARSGDKGDRCNIGVIARRPDYYAILLDQLSADRVRAWFGAWCRGDVTRYELPKLEALNFVLDRALDGGGLASLRLDRQGKTYGFALLRMPIEIPDDLEVVDLLDLAGIKSER
jgi:hypothetical protein